MGVSDTYEKVEEGGGPNLLKGCRSGSRFKMAA